MARLVSILGAILIATTGPAGAQDSSIEAGEKEYMVACAGCHGEGGKGGGPLAGLLKIETPNLTTINERTGGGDFPFYNTLKLIDGREVRAHGGEMPIWGDRYAESAIGPRSTLDVSPEAAEFVTRGRLVSLVLYLQSIQE